MQLSRVSKKEVGLEAFLNFAFVNSSRRNEIMCLCKKRINTYWQTREIVHGHLICERFMVNYV